MSLGPVINIDIAAASQRIKPVTIHTPLQLHNRLSEKYQWEVYIKREDQQHVRSYKIRGAYNKIITLPKEKLQKGIVCASAGNHAQGVAYICHHLQLKGVIFMPVNTPQ